MDCPRCSAPMQEESLSDRLGRSVAIDMCVECQSFWFDSRESFVLTPASTLRLFRIIGESARAPQPAPSSYTRCPRCRTLLKPTQDMQHATRFQYLACPEGHGRFISFVEFLREKSFVKPLTPQQMATLRSQVQFINCANCGAPIDLSPGSSCASCHSPLSMLDLQHAEGLVEQLRQAESDPQHKPPQDPAMLREMQQLQMRALLQPRTMRPYHEDGEFLTDLSRVGPIFASVNAVVRWLATPKDKA